MQHILDRIEMVKRSKLGDEHNNAVYLQKLKDLIVSYEWTQVETAFVFNCTQSSINNILKGRTKAISVTMRGMLDSLV